MFIETVECPVTEFQARRFLIQSEEALRAILATSATHALVNQQQSTIDVKAVMNGAAKAQEAIRQNTVEAVSESARSLRDSFMAAQAGTLKIEALGPVADEIAERIEAAPDVFLEVTRLKTKDEGTYVHSLAVSALMMQLARSLGYENDAIRELGVAGLLHDVGKLMVPNAVLNKTGRLDANERQLVRNHPEIGYRILRQQGNVSDIVLDVCRLHHEALDGSGYPLGLKGDKISAEVRLATVCDVFEALTSARPYKKAWSTKDAITWMFDHSQMFDKKLVLRLGSMFS
jgi:putative nucleotidyltransferase with HDIG domain